MILFACSLWVLTHVDEEKRELAKDMHIFACLGVPLMDFTKWVVMKNGAESSLVSKVNEKHDK